MARFTLKREVTLTVADWSLIRGALLDAIGDTRGEGSGTYAVLTDENRKVLHEAYWEIYDSVFEQTTKFEEEEV